MLQATVSSARHGFSYERARFTAWDYQDFMARLESEIRLLSTENPDSILIRMDRPATQTGGAR